VNFLIYEGQRAITTVCDAIDDVVRDIFNTWFSSCHSSLDEVGGAQCLDDAIEENDCIYRAMHDNDMTVVLIMQVHQKVNLLDV